MCRSVIIGERRGGERRRRQGEGVVRGLEEVDRLFLGQKKHQDKKNSKKCCSLKQNGCVCECVSFSSSSSLSSFSYSLSL